MFLYVKYCLRTMQLLEIIEKISKQISLFLFLSLYIYIYWLLSVWNPLISGTKSLSRTLRHDPRERKDNVLGIRIFKMADDQYTTYRMSLWDNGDLPMSLNPSRSVPNISSVSMPPATNYVVPYLRYSFQVPAPINNNGLQLQQYQQSKYQSQTFQPTQTSASNTR